MRFLYAGIVLVIWFAICGHYQFHPMVVIAGLVLPWLVVKYGARE